MAVGAGCVVACWYMVLAFGRLSRNGRCSVEVVLVVRKFCMIGPHRPCGSSANASRIVLASSRSFMMVSPGIDLADGVLVSGINISFVTSILFSLTFLEMLVSYGR